MKEVIKKLKPYVPEASLEEVKKKYNLSRLVRLSANENPYGTSQAVYKAVEAVIRQGGNYYPDGNASALRKELAAFYKQPEDRLVIGTGLDELIALICRVFLQSGDEVLVMDPAFSEYAFNSEIEGASIKKVPVNKDTGHIDVNEIIKAVTDKTKLLWICNPNNPTGVYESKACITNLMAQLPSDVIVLMDEAYLEFTCQEEAPSALPLLDRYDNLIVMKTFSKAYGLAAYRVGFLAASVKLANYMQTVRLPYNVNTISQVAAQAALGDQAFLHKVVKANDEERRKWLAFLSKVAIDHYDSQSNFIYMRFEEAEELADYLLQHGYQVRRGLQPHWLRITIGKADDNQAIQGYIKEFLGE